MKHLLVPVLFLLGAAAAAAQPSRPPEPEQDVRAFLARFVQAFDNLDWEKFRSCFADDATVFQPRGFARRADGRNEIEREFHIVFDFIRGNKTAPPYMALDPQDLRVQSFGDTAIVTFHLADRPGFVNRRTLVLHRDEAGWKIVHLHASEVAVAAPAPPH